MHRTARPGLPAKGPWQIRPRPPGTPRPAVGSLFCRKLRENPKNYARLPAASQNPGHRPGEKFRQTGDRWVPGCRRGWSGVAAPLPESGLPAPEPPLFPENTAGSGTPDRSTRQHLPPNTRNPFPPGTPKSEAPAAWFSHPPPWPTAERRRHKGKTTKAPQPAPENRAPPPPQRSPYSGAQPNRLPGIPRMPLPAMPTAPGPDKSPRSRPLQIPA